MNDNQLLTRLAESNLYGEETPLPEAVWTRDLALHEIERRTGMDTRDTTNMKATPPGVTQQIEPSPIPKASATLPTEKGKRRWSGALVGAVAFTVVVVVGVAILLASRDSDELAPATPVTTQAPPTAPPTTQAAPPITVDEALAVKDAFMEAVNTDAEAALALLAPQPTISVPVLARRVAGSGFDLDPLLFERYLAWSIAQGTTVTASDCTATEFGAAVRVSCDLTRDEYTLAAAGAPPFEGDMYLIVLADGIGTYSERFAEDEAGREGAFASFDRWLEENHPEDFDTGVRFQRWDSVADAERGGILRAEYADEWAAHLAANGCTYENPDC